MRPYLLVTKWIAHFFATRRLQDLYDFYHFNNRPSIQLNALSVTQRRHCTKREMFGGFGLLGIWIEILLFGFWIFIFDFGAMLGLNGRETPGASVGQNWAACRMQPLCLENVLYSEAPSLDGLIRLLLSSSPCWRSKQHYLSKFRYHRHTNINVT